MESGPKQKEQECVPNQTESFLDMNSIQWSWNCRASLFFIMDNPYTSANAFGWSSINNYDTPVTQKMQPQIIMG